MSIVLVGKTTLANILVTDAMVTMKDNSTSFRDCGLKDKISKLESANGYFAILGDENVKYGISVLDSWSYQKNIPIDFTNPKTIKNALVVTEKFIIAFKKQGHKQPETDGAIVYFLVDDKIFEYNLIRTNDKYSIDSFRFFNNNEVVLNYAGNVEHISIGGSLNDYFENAKKKIKATHEKRKLLSQSNKGIACLKYDFDNRFCGVLMGSNIKTQILLPYKYLSDIVAAQIDDWDLIEDKNFMWTPSN
jgi:hypothetical protein